MSPHVSIREKIEAELFTRCSLLVVKSLVTRAKICSLLVAEVACCKKSLVTRFRSCSLQNFAPCKKSLVALWKIRSLLHKFTKKSLLNLVTHDKIKMNLNVLHK